MMKLSRSAWIAIAAIAAVPATVAIAKSMDGRGWHRASPETRMRLDEGRIAMAKAALKLTADQEKLWTPVEEQVRAAFKAREAKRAEWDADRAQRSDDKSANTEKRGDKRADLAERFEKMTARMTERAERMKNFTAAFKPFYASLSDEQKDVLRPLMRDLAPGFGRGGHRGRHWAHGGWGPGGHDGAGRHGWGHHHRFGMNDMPGDSKDDVTDSEAPAVAPPSDGGGAQ